MNKTLIAGAIGASLMASGCASFDRDDDAGQRLYVGAGALISELEPDADGVPGIDVDESRSGGGSVLLGYDVNHRFSLEGNYAQLGEATLAPDGQIDYSVVGLSALIYGLSGRADRARREGFSAYGRAGVGRLDNDSDVPIEQINDFNVLLGLGTEYGFRNGLGVRAELVAHDQDVAYAQLALVYRIGDQPPRRAASAEASVKESMEGPNGSAADKALQSADILEPVEVVPAPTGTALASSDTDRDGVTDERDECVETVPGRPVDVQGCDLLDGPVDGVVFNSGSETLTASARQVLDEIAATLVEYPATRISIEAHTDNVGAAEDNLQLSRRRALAVANHLLSRGVAGDRLVPRAFGESRPLVRNSTAEGRMSNRRVEFRFQ